MNEETRNYTATAKWLHWMIAFAIFFLFGTVLLMHMDLPSSYLGTLYTSHKTAGILVLALTLIRIGWRYTHKPPRLPKDIMPKWQVRAAHGAHFLLYALSLLTPIAGWLLSSASPYSIKFFGLWTVPKIPVESSSYIFYKEMHEAFGIMIAIILVVHIGGAIMHHFVDRDNILLRMSPECLDGFLTRLR